MNIIAQTRTSAGAFSYILAYMIYPYTRMSAAIRIHSIVCACVVFVLYAGGKRSGFNDDDEGKNSNEAKGEEDSGDSGAAASSTAPDIEGRLRARVLPRASARRVAPT